MSEEICEKIAKVQRTISGLERLIWLLDDINNILRDIDEFQDRLGAIVNDLKERVEFIKMKIGKKWSYVAIFSNVATNAGLRRCGDLS